MAFKKIPKDVWNNMSAEDQKYYSLMFQKSIEDRKRIFLYITRGLALFCIFTLLFIGYAMILNAKDYGNLFDEYGPNAHCYLCGEKTLRRCECQYHKSMDYGNIILEGPNYTKLRKETAEFNIEECKPYDYYLRDKIDNLLVVNHSNMVNID